MKESRRKALPHTEISDVARKRLTRLRGESIDYETGTVKKAYPGTGVNRAGVELGQPSTWSGPLDRSARFMAETLIGIDDLRRRRGQ